MTNTILQVEDDANDVFLFRHAMKKAGVTNPLQVATDGQEAIDYLSGTGKFEDREQFPLPDLVLLDLKLPGGMGLDVLRWIRKQPGMAPVIVILSASAEDEDIATAYLLGANAFLTKPSEASKLESMVRAIKDFWLTHNTLPLQSCEQRAPAHSSRIDPGARDLPVTIGIMREECNPANSKRTYEKNNRINL
jgi:two-component system response regulator